MCNLRISIWLRHYLVFEEASIRRAILLGAIGTKPFCTGKIGAVCFQNEKASCPGESETTQHEPGLRILRALRPPCGLDKIDYYYRGSVNFGSDRILPSPKEYPVIWCVTDFKVSMAEPAGQPADSEALCTPLDTEVVFLTRT